jgi:hypothetical protein
MCDINIHITKIHNILLSEVQELGHICRTGILMGQTSCDALQHAAWCHALASDMDEQMGHKYL